jgi:hypothetical protein
MNLIKRLIRAKSLEPSDPGRKLFAGGELP